MSSSVKSKSGTEQTVDLSCLALSAMDTASANMMIADLDGNIIYANAQSLNTLRGAEDAICEAIKGFSADALVGSSYDALHKDPSYQRAILKNPKNLPHEANIDVGGLVLALKISGIEVEGEYSGVLVEWEEISARLAAEATMTQIKTGLDKCTTNVMICDQDLEVIYMNESSLRNLSAAEAEIKAGLPSFSASQVVGSNIDIFHQNPALQRKLLGDPANLPYATEIQIGPLKLALTASAIISDDGEHLGSIAEWSNITDQKAAEVEVDRMINAASAGVLTERMDEAKFEGFFKDLAGGINRMFDAIATPITEACDVLEKLSSGDLRMTMDKEYEGDFDTMKSSMNSAIDNLNIVVKTVRENASAVSSGATEISKGTEDLAQRTSRQASALEETSASVEQMTATVKQNADNAKQANQLAIAAREVAEKGGSVTTNAVEAMSEINKSSKQIADIITVIDEIAFQTNLLALNAAVEAARAGEQGRGFAVVAAEVRNLAQRSAGAAKEIKGLINESVQRVTEGSELVNESGSTLEQIVESVKRVTDIIGEITAASQEQASGIDQINKAIADMDEVTQQNAALVEETASSSQNMADQSVGLSQQVEFFTVDAQAAAPAASSAPAATSSAASRPAASKPASSPAPASDDDFEEF